MMTNKDVLIVGAGPVGLTLACELLRRGIDCRVIERSLLPNTHSKAFAVHSRSLEILENIGVIDAILADCKKVEKMTVYSRNRNIITVDFNHLDVPYPFVASIPQNRLEAILTDQLKTLGGSIERGIELTSMSQNPGDVVATLSNIKGGHQTHSVDWLVGCDGAHSTVRNKLGLPLEGSSYDMAFVVADAELAWNGAADEGHTYLTNNGYAMVFPLPGQLHRVVVDTPLNRNGDHSPSLDAVHELLKQRGLSDLRLSNPIWISSTRIHCRMVPKFQTGRIFLAGDAAHIHSPIGGQGMNTGIQDAYNLAWKLAYTVRKQASPKLLDSYHSERSKVAKEVLANTDAMTHMLTTRNPLRVFLRNRIIPKLNRRVQVQRKLAYRASGMEINYVNSPIAINRFQGFPLVRWVASKFHSPKAGERAPDGPVFKANDRKPRRLFHYLEGVHYQLLIFAGKKSSSTAIEKLIDIKQKFEKEFRQIVTVNIIYPVSTSHQQGKTTDSIALFDVDAVLHQRYGVNKQAMFLIRPDGYIACRSESKAIAKFTSKALRHLVGTTEKNDLQSLVAKEKFS